MDCEIYAHKEVGMNINVSGGLTVSCPAGGKVKHSLTGDQFGVVEAHLESQARKLPEHRAGGRIVCEERDAAPPEGSKKALQLAAEAAAAEE